MPLYKVETMEVFHKIYYIEATTKEAAAKAAHEGVDEAGYDTFSEDFDYSYTLTDDTIVTEETGK